MCLAQPITAEYSFFDQLKSEELFDAEKKLCQAPMRAPALPSQNTSAIKAVNQNFVHFAKWCVLCVVGFARFPTLLNGAHDCRMTRVV